MVILWDAYKTSVKSRNELSAVNNLSDKTCVCWKSKNMFSAMKLDL